MDRVMRAFRVSGALFICGAFVAAGAARAQGTALVCINTLICSNGSCFTTDPDDGQGGFVVENPRGPGTTILVDGVTTPVTLEERQGSLSWSGVKPDGEQILLSVNRADGTFMVVQTGAGRVWVATGRCTG